MRKWISRRQPARNVAHGLEREHDVLADLDREIACAAASLRARHAQLRLPDALVIATAIERSADELLTTDCMWPTARALELDITITQV